MRTPSKSTVGYAPESIPLSIDSEVSRYLKGELDRISYAIQALADGHLEKTYAAPAKPRDGDIRYADGSTWNPGAGAGIYFYNGSVWTKL